MVNVDVELMHRILRQLSAVHHIEEIGQDTYTLTPFTEALGDPVFSSLYPFFFDINGPGFANLPSFLESIDYRNPLDPAQTNFQHWKGAGETLFKFLGDNPSTGQHFQNAMMVYASAKTSWTDLYPTKSIIAAQKPDRTLVVDVGGGQGHDLERFRAKHPEVSNGSLVLQDLQNVLEGVVGMPPVVAVAQDFFTPNPVQGARIYYLHCVLHDWPDAKAAEILKNIAVSMERGYSRILLHENVISALDPHPRATSSDLTMMMCFSAMERSEKMWSDIVALAGLKIVKIWNSPEAVESIIEIELP